MTALFLALLAAVLAVGAWAAINLFEQRSDDDLQALILSEKLVEELDVEADRWRWGR